MFGSNPRHKSNTDVYSRSLACLKALRFHPLVLDISDSLNQAQMTFDLPKDLYHALANCKLTSSCWIILDANEKAFLNNA